ncbi:MAG TPA: hypothetical protein VFS44_07070 [Gemmatimonadaceae bacterium]|nr:hypothetical protein [Gemmatimonadaceae bacterium]
MTAPAGDETRARPSRPPLAARLALALAVGGTSGWIAHTALLHRGVLAGDFTWPWRAARILLQGHDPYVVIQATGRYPFDNAFLYPLPAALVTLPFAPLRAELAGALFVALGAALLAFVITRDDWHRVPMLASAPFLKLLLAPQWSALMVVAALAPGFQWLAVAKPNVGLAAFAYRPTRAGVLGGAAVLAVSLAVLPAWPAEWLRIAAHVRNHPAPVAMPFGFLLLLAALRWRTPEGRLLLAMAVLPQELLVYDQLLLWLIPRRWWSSLLMAVASWPALVAWVSPEAFGLPRAAAWPLTERVVMLCIYLPALAMVLLRRRHPSPGADVVSGQRATRTQWSISRTVTRLPYMRSPTR